MAVARSTRENFDYILKVDRELPLQQQTIWTLRRLSVATMLSLENLHGLDRTTNAISLRSGDAKIVMLAAGIANWTNFCDASGTPIECQHEAGDRNVRGVTIHAPVKQSSLDWVPHEMAQELIDAIWNGSTLTTDDVKN